jgi:hypothetical protein
MGGLFWKFATMSIKRLFGRAQSRDQKNGPIKTMAKWQRLYHEGVAAVFVGRLY